MHELRIENRVTKSLGKVKWNEILLFLAHFKGISMIMK